jgi:hypothetical protein
MVLLCRIIFQIRHWLNDLQPGNDIMKGIRHPHAIENYVLRGVNVNISHPVLAYVR